VRLQHWDGSYIYWQVTDESGTRLTSQVDTAHDYFWAPRGNSNQNIYFTFNADATTDGIVTYYVHFSEDSNFVGDVMNIGPNYCLDTSQAPALVLDLDPANLALFWTDTSGMHNDASYAGIVPSADNGGVFGFNGESSYANVPTLTDSTFSSVTVSAWIKPSTVNTNQTIISKEICFKMTITTDGRIAWMVGDVSGNSWTTTIYAESGLVTAGAWAHVMATVNASATKIYINGVKVAQGSGATLIANSFRFAIGAYDSGPSTYGDYFGGRIGEVKMWNYAIGGGDARTEYNTTAARYGRSTVASPLSLGFNGTDNHYVRISDNTSDWNLGNNYTIEWWEKCVGSSLGYYRGVLAQDSNSEPNLLGFDIYHANGQIQLWNNRKNFYEPTPGQWNHIAIQKPGFGIDVQVFVNGVLTSPAGDWPSTLTNGSLELIVGSRTVDGGATFYSQYFKGQLADIRISNYARYNLNFTPPESLVVDASVKLALSGELTDLSSRNHTITNNGVSQDTDFPY
jgi:hypothetical protein